GASAAAAARTAPAPRLPPRVMTRLKRLIPRREVGKPPSPLATLGLAAAAILTLAGLFALAITAQRGLPGVRYYDLTADFRDAQNLTNFADVRMAGKRVGQVVDVRSRRG